MAGLYDPSPFARRAAPAQAVCGGAGAAARGGKVGPARARAFLGRHVAQAEPHGPYGFDEAGPKFDGQIVDAIKSGEPGKILSIDPALARKAGECGWKPAVFSLGALEGDALDAGS